MSESSIERARAGDSGAFAALIEPYRRELHLHCYRILGSLVDADDLVQETFLAAWRGLEGFTERSSVRTWLYRIATRRCLNAIRDNKRRPPTAPVPPFDPPIATRQGETTWLQPYPDALLDQAADSTSGPAQRSLTKETVELTFIAALQRLTPRQTAVIVLRDVLTFSTAETADVLDTTPTVVKGLLQRARAALERARWTPVDAAPDPASAIERDLARRFAAAFTADDVDGVVALLTDDAWLAMPPAPHEYHGRGPIRAFLDASAAYRAGRHFAVARTRVNRQPAFVCSLGGTPTSLLALTLNGRRIAGITHFLDPTLASRLEGFKTPHRSATPSAAG